VYRLLNRSPERADSLWAAVRDAHESMTVNQKLPRQGRDDVSTSGGSLRAFLEQTTRSPKTDRPPPNRDDAVHPVAGCPVYDGFNTLPWGPGPKDGGMT
jgi:hypothetical protein